MERTWQKTYGKSKREQQSGSIPSQLHNKKGDKKPEKHKEYKQEHNKKKHRIEQEYIARERKE